MRLLPCSLAGLLLVMAPVLAAPPPPAPAWLKMVDQGGNDPRLKGYRTPEGVKVEVVAAAPVVVNPVGMTFADDGTPFVLEWRPSPGDERHETSITCKYRDGSTRRIAAVKKRVKDVVKTLRDGTGKGTYDQATIVLEDELPSSIRLYDGWLYLSGRGTVRRMRSSKPGGPYDVREVIAQGFGGFGQRQVSGLTLGNDGWLYVTAGAGANLVEGSDGSRATVLGTGAVFRCRPDGSKMHVFATGFHNPYRDVAFDALGNLFHADNGSQSAGCRLLHVAEGNDFGGRPGRLPALRDMGRGAVAGLHVYEGTRFPEKFRGLILCPDVLRQVVRAYRVERRGATFAVTEAFDFFQSNDPLFRPCQVVAGPDGALYVVDWRTDSGGAGRLWGDGTHGRIYRLSWAGTKDEPARPPRPLDAWAGIARLDDAELVKTLASPESGDRERARRELVKRGAKNRAALLKLLLDDGEALTARVAALGALQAMWDGEVQKAFATVVENGDADLRRLAADGLGLCAASADPGAHNVLLRALSDADPAVRRAAALAMARIGAPGSADALVNNLAFDEGKDLYLREGLIRAIEALGRGGIERLVALTASGDAKELDRAVEAFTTLRTRPAFAALPGLLANPHLSIDQRAALVRSAANYRLDPPVALAPLLDYLASQPAEAVAVKKAGLEVLTGSDALKGPKGTAWLRRLGDDSDPEVRRLAARAAAAASVK